MRVLFVPYPAASHGIPLVALWLRGQDSGIDGAFLLPRRFHTTWRSAGVPVLTIDSDNSLRAELEAYRVFRPDVVIDDCSLSTGYASALSNIPRITIMRAVYSDGYSPRNPRYKFALVPDVRHLADVSFLGLQQPKRISDLFKATHYVVPGISSIETVPPSSLAESVWSFAGPLLLPDSWIERLLVGPAEAKSVRTSLAEFFDRNRRRPLLYMTFGTVAIAPHETELCIHRFLKEGVAVVSSVYADGMTSAQRELFAFSQFVPMHYVCSNVNVMVHQCGTGTCYYPLMHALPTITVGTRSVERDDTALRLQDLGVSTHVFHPENETDFVDTLVKRVYDYLQRQPGPAYAARLKLLREEIHTSSAAFEFQTVLHAAMDRRAVFRRDQNSAP